MSINPLISFFQDFWIYTWKKYLKPLKKIARSAVAFVVFVFSKFSPNRFSLQLSVFVNSCQQRLWFSLIRYWSGRSTPGGRIKAVTKNHCYSTKYWLLSSSGISWRHHHYYYDVLKPVNLFRLHYSVGKWIFHVRIFLLVKLNSNLIFSL